LLSGLGYRARQRKRRRLAEWEDAVNTTSGAITQDIGANGSVYVELFDLDDEEESATVGEDRFGKSTRY
jgi:hypothetical protein